MPLVVGAPAGAPLPGTPAAKLLEELQAEKDEAEAQKQAALIEQGVIPDPTEETPPPPPDDIPPEDASAEMPPEAGAAKAVDDLALWERKALRTFKARGRAAVGFKSESIDPDDHARISEALKAAHDVAAVKAAFRGIDGLIERELDGALVWAQEAMEKE